MAEENVVMNLSAHADFSNLVANVNKVSASLVKMQQQVGTSNRIVAGQIAAINKAFSDTLKNTGQFNTHFVTLSDDVAKFGNSLDKGQLKLRDYYSAWQQHNKTSGGLVRDLARQQVQLQNAILQPLGKNAQGLQQFNVQVASGLDLVKHKGAIATEELKIMNRVMQQGADGLINWGKNTQWAGRQLTVGLTVPIAAFGMAAAKAFREADAELVRLTKVYGGVAAVSTAELKKIRNEVSATATELSKAYGTSFKETIGLAADLAATGKQGNDLLKATAETTRLMVLGEVDRQDAMKTTLTIQNTFKQNTKELAESINFLNAVENQTSLTIQDLTEAIPKAGPVVKALGGDVKDLALYLTAMKEGGINASEGANAIKSALASLINPTKVSTELFQSFGINLRGIVENNRGDVTQMLLSLQSALDGLDPLSKSRAIEQLFGKFQFARISALIDNLGKSGSQSLQVLDLLKKSTSEIGALADRELKQVTESASGKYNRAVEGLRADLAGIGDEFLKVATFFINVTDKVVNFVNKLPGPIKSILTFLAGLTAVSGPLIMLAGVMANFIGYVIKGAFHLKALFKSGEGWRMLTPEILAAQKAGSLVEKTFYSDAQAALALAEALAVLNSGYTTLNANINKGVVSVQPQIQTMAGSIVIPGGQGSRFVDPRNPLVGEKGTRASAHTNPLAGRTAEQIAQSTIYGFTPAAIPVNNAIKDAPQMYSNGDLPSVPGLTTAMSKKHGEVSVGIVAQEATKWHTLMGTLSMMSKTEVATMKKEIHATGAVSSDFMAAYSSLLPEITKISEDAVTKSAAIVSQVKSGEMSIAAAKEKLIQLNYQIEAAMGTATTGVATSLGRTANLTTVPTLDQPVVDPTGKSNMRQIFGKKNAAWMDKLASAMGVKTWGASYSTHTTIPKRLNAGGAVYDPSRDGNVVPGDTSINYDNTPARLREGGFILNQDASRNNPDLVGLAKNSYNSGGKVIDALLTPGETYFPPEVAQSMMPTLEKANSGSRIELKNAGGILGGLVSNGRYSYGRDILSGLATGRKRDRIRNPFGIKMRGQKVESFVSQIGDIKDAAQREKYLLLTRQFANKQTTASEDPRYFNRRASKTLSANKIDYLNDLYVRWGLPPLPHARDYHDTHWTVSDLLGAGRSLVSKYVVGYSAESNLAANNNKLSIRGLFQRDLIKRAGVNKYKSQLEASGIPQGRWDEAETNIDNAIRNFFENEALKNGTTIDQLPSIGDRPGKATYTFAQHFIPLLEKELEKMDPRALYRSKYRDLKKNMVLRNAGGVIGGVVQSGRLGYGRTMPQAVIDRLTAKWPATRQFYQPGFQYKLGNQDPLHGPLQIGMSQNLKRYPHSADNPYFRESVVYRDPRFDRINIMEAFLTGTAEKRGKYATAQYMEGNMDIMSQMERLGNHPLGPIAAMRSVQKKFSGKLFRGITLDKTFKGLPQDLIEAIKIARDTGDVSNLLGKEFIMRRSSWSKSANIASFFAPGYKKDKDRLLIEAIVKNRNILPAGDMFPDKKFMAPYGQDWSGGKLGGQYKSEKEAIFGGKFRIIGFDKGRLKVETVVDGARENGGPVNAGRPYLVGEKGPELFVPRNSGGIIPNYALGGKVMSGKTGYGKMNPVASYLGKQALGMLAFSMMGPMLSKMGLPKVVTDNAFTALFMGQIAHGAYKTNKAVKAARAAQAGTAVGETAIAAEGAEKAVARFSPRLLALGSVAARVAGPIGVLVTALQVYQMINNNRRHNQEVLATSFGLTAKTAKEAGVQVRDLNSILKESEAAAKSGHTKAALSFANDNANVKGISLTVKELNDLEKKVKKTMPSYVEAFKKMTGPEIASGATNIKAQWVAMGMNVQEANAKIYSLIKLTHGQSTALATMNNQAFQSITDKASAAKESINMLAYAIKHINNLGKEGVANSFNTFLQTQTARFEDLVNKPKDKDTKTPYADAYSSLMDQYKNKGLGNLKLPEGMITELAKTDPILASMLNKSDTIASAMSKWVIATAGTIDNLEIIGNLSDKDANKLAAGMLVIQDSVSKGLSADKLTGAKQKEIKNLQDALLKSQNASAGMAVKDQIASKKKIKALEDEIKKINEAAAARKKAMEQQQINEDVITAIKKKQLEYQQALASGDMTAAAQAQLDIQMMSSNRQTDIAKNSIDISAAAQIKPLQDQIDKLNESLNNSADAQALAADSMSKASSKLSDLISKDNALKTALDKAMVDSILTKTTAKEWKEDLRNLVDAYGELNGLAKKNGKWVGTDGKPIDEQALFDRLKSLAVASMTVAAQNVVIQASQITTGNGLGPGVYTGSGGGGSSGPDQAKSDAIKKKTGQTPVTTPSSKITQFYQNPDPAFKKPYTPVPVMSLNSINYRRVGMDSQGNNIEYLANGQVKNLATGKQVGWWYGDWGNNPGKYTFDPTKTTGFNQGGSVRNYEEGSTGGVRGPGTGTSDSIPAYLSNGEYVIKADSVKKYGVETFDALNAQRFSGGSPGGVKDGNFFSRFNPVNGISNMLSGMFNLGVTQTMKSAPPSNYKSQVTQHEKDDILLQTGQMISGYTSAFNLKNGTSPEIFGHKSLGVGADVLGVLPIIGAGSKLTRLATAGAKSAIVPKTVVHASMGKQLSLDTIESIRQEQLNIAKTRAQIADMESGKFYEDNLWANRDYHTTSLENLNASVARAMDYIRRGRQTDTPPGFFAGLDMYIQKPMFAQGSAFDVIASATSRSSAATDVPFYRALSGMDMAQIVGPTRIPHLPNLKMGKAWMQQHGITDTEMWSPWSHMARHWKPNATELIKASGKPAPDFNSVEANPFMDMGKPLKIGESWIPPMHKSMTQSLDFAKDIAINAGTGGGGNPAIARFILGPNARGIKELTGIAEGAGSWKYPTAGEGLMAPWSEYVLKAINKNKHNYTMPGVDGKEPTLTHLIDEYVFEVVGQQMPSDFKPFYKKAMGGYVGIPKFDQGINMVPADMLAMIHKNEAVVPASMNPFNPNANNATMGNTIYLTNNITAAPGMDTELLARRVADMTKQSLSAEMNINASKVGINNQFGSKVMN